MEKKAHKSHCIVLPYPTQGHINPMFQFSKRIQNKGVKVTLVTTNFISKSIKHKPPSSSSIVLETISDGYDEGGIEQAESIKVYLESFKKVGTKTLFELLDKLSNNGLPVNCIVYDAFMPWCLEVAKKYGLISAVFFTQSCAVDIIYYNVFKGLIRPPLDQKTQILVPGLVPLEIEDLPSFIHHYGSYPAAFEMLVDQFCNIDQIDCVLCNTFYELEQESADWLAKLWPLRTIGPTIPSMYLDKHLQDDKDYGFCIFKPNNESCMNWLNQKPKRSVVYVSFGSLATVSNEQIQELCCALKSISKTRRYYFLWVVRESEQNKLPKNFIEEVAEKGNLVVNWCPQLDVLANEATGCFVSHCGWNSTLEALSLGVAMVGMPLWTDQTTNAKYIMDVWKVGIRASADEKGIFRDDVIKDCIKEVMDGERRECIIENVEKWKKLAKTAASEGGNSDRNITEFVNNLISSN